MFSRIAQIASKASFSRNPKRFSTQSTNYAKGFFGGGLTPWVACSTLWTAGVGYYWIQLDEEDKRLDMIDEKLEKVMKNIARDEETAKRLKEFLENRHDRGGKHGN